VSPSTHPTISTYTLSLLTTLLLALAFIGTNSAVAEEHDDDVHRVVIQVSSNDPATMNLALNNASNINQYYMDQGEEAEIEVVTFGPGLHMLRGDSSPVIARIASMAQNYDNIHYKACANTMKGMAAKSGKEVELVAAAEVVPSGVIHIMQRQQQGWSYIKP